MNHLFHIAKGWLEEHIFSERQFVILCYHGVSDRAGEDDPGALKVSISRFRQQMTYLMKTYHVVSLPEILTQIRDKQLLKTKQVVITFDDGYADNYDNAYPILQEYGLPATIFLTSKHIGTTQVFWWDRLRHILWTSAYEHFDFNIIGVREYSLKTVQEKHQTFFGIHEPLRRMKLATRLQVLEELTERLQAVPNEYEHDDFPLQWEQIREMDSALISFGAHSCTHPVLDTLNEQELTTEILDSKTIIEQHLNKKITLFGYPYGGEQDFNEIAKSILKTHHFECGCSMAFGANTKDTDLFALRRASIGNWDTEMFGATLWNTFRNIR